MSEIRSSARRDVGVDSTSRGAALVSGAGSGIGRAAALALARRGYPLVLLGRRAAPLAETLAAAGGQGAVFAVDVRDATGVQAAVAESVERGFLPEVVLPAAGVARVAPFAELTSSALAENVETNLLGPLHLYQAALPLMVERGGHLFAILSVAATRGFPGWAGYCASKWGLRGAIAALREEMAGSAVRITEIFPGATDSPLWETVPGEWNRQAMLAPEAIASAVVWAIETSAEAAVEAIHLQPKGGNL